MRGAVLGPGAEFQTVPLEDPVPGPGELVLRVTGCGICGSDLKAHGAMPQGTVMGHEFSGEVVAVGAGVPSEWRVGMSAASLPVFSCGTCARCRSGHVAHCSAAQLVGLGGAPGAFAEYLRVSAALSCPLPESIPPSHGPLVEPFAVGLHTARIAEITTGDRVLIVGGGPVALTTSMWAREMGAATITVSELAAGRRDAAELFGATSVLDPAVDELGGPYDVVIECVGRPGLLDGCAAAADVHGRIVIAGVCADPDPYLPIIPLLKELQIRFSVYYRPDEFQEVVSAFTSGRIDPGNLITSTVGLGRLNEVFAQLKSSTDDLKIIIDPSI